jgi:hypothetical protein
MNAGFLTHEQTRFSRGGSRGAPEGLWDSVESRTLIQAVLDTGNYDILGVTYHPDYPSVFGYQQWVDYALGTNPDMIFFIGASWTRYPHRQTLAEMENDIHSSLHDYVHPIIDTLRSLYPNNRFFSIPYGFSAVHLRSMFEAGNLPDIQHLTGTATDAIYTDSLGHSGQMLQSLSSLVWLGAIYGVDLDTFPNPFSYTTDLRPIAKAILSSHDSCYRCGGENCLTTSIEAVRPEDHISIFPNPSSGIVFVDVKTVPQGTLSISTVFGKAVMQLDVSQGLIQVPELPTGVYLASLFRNDRLLGRVKFVVQ